VISNLAALTQALPVAGREFRILPAGVFRAKDGRPAHLPGWKIDGEIARRVIAASVSSYDMVIDYEHQTINAEKNGQPAPAAGWFKRMVWREGHGLFAVDVQWTDKAKTMIAAGEYRHISPVFPYDAVTGEVLKIIGLGLTNNPALPGLANLAALSVQRPGIAGQRDSDKAIQAFNRVFGKFGCYHPDTPAETIAALSAQPVKPRFPAGLEQSDPRGAEALRRLAPDAWED
jgi:phage I-like protein